MTACRTESRRMNTGTPWCASTPMKTVCWTAALPPPAAQRRAVPQRHPLPAENGAAAGRHKVSPGFQHPPGLRRKRRGKGQRSSRNRTQDGQNRHLHRQGHLPAERQLQGSVAWLEGGSEQRFRSVLELLLLAGQRPRKRLPDGKEQLTPAKFPGDPGPDGPLKDTDHGKPPERAGRKGNGAKALRHASPAASIPFLLQKMRRRTK